MFIYYKKLNRTYYVYKCQVVPIRAFGISDEPKPNDKSGKMTEVF